MYRIKIGFFRLKPVLFGVILLFQLAVGESDAAEQKVGSDTISYEGYTRFQFRSRWGGGDKDRDLYQSLFLDIKPEDQQEPDWNFTALGHLSKDLDVGQGFSEFHDVYNSYRDSTDTRLYFGYLDINNLGFVNKDSRVKRIRLGRQDLLGTGQLLQFDGIRLDSRIFKEESRRIQLSVYGGDPVDYYNSDASDSLFGVILQSRPKDKLRLRLDWVEVEDKHNRANNFWPGVQVDNKDDFLAFSTWYSGWKNFKLHSRYTLLESDVKKLHLRGSYSRPDRDLIASVSYSQLNNSILQYSNDFDPFFTTLSALRPYHHTQVNLWKGLSENRSIDAGVSLRLLRDSSDDSLYNHDFKTFYLSHNTTGLRDGKVDLTLTMNYWSASGRNDMITYGGQVDYHDNGDWKYSGGIYYDLYKYNDIVAVSNSTVGANFNTVAEKEDIYTYFVEAKWKRSAHRHLSFKFEYEAGQFSSYKTVRVGYTYRF